jgi:AcrR family transcriptional regulator
MPAQDENRSPRRLRGSRLLSTKAGVSAAGGAQLSSAWRRRRTTPIGDCLTSRPAGLGLNTLPHTRLLVAAWKHFSTRPYEEVRLREIAGDALVTEQTLLARFHSKDELLTAAYSWWAMSEKSRRDAAPVGRFPEAVAIVFDHYEAHGTAILRMLSQEERIPAVRHLTDRGRDYHRDWASRIFQPQLVGQRRASRERPLTAIVIATDVLVWKLLRLDMQLSRPQAEKTVDEMIQSHSRRSS